MVEHLTVSNHSLDATKEQLSVKTTREQWRAVPGYEGLYEVSDQGRVRSLDRLKPNGNTHKGRVLKPWYWCGYAQIGLTKRGRSAKFGVHRLVMMTFVGPKPSGLVTRHLNGVCTDNRLVNLKYGTYSENAYDRTAHGNNRNAAKTHCVNGHEFTPENIVPNSGGTGRTCRICMYVRVKKYQAEKAEESRRRGPVRPNTPDEQWRPVPGYEGLYSVSDQGRVRSESRLDGLGRQIRERILKPGQRGGWLIVNLADNSVHTVFSVHRLVMLAFVGPKPEGHIIRHLNDDPLDNWLNNLEYGTPAQNAEDRSRNRRTA
jgi:hypothetical protein